MRLHRSDDYRADLSGIAEHIAQSNPAAALGMWDTIERQVERLVDHPRSGRLGRIPETRELVVAGTPYIIVYRIGQTVELLRVLHGARRWPP
ncbi:type II toxin-antitoxin system RelE/ParE family toxin [Inquilinus sp.]|jgi:toxin ParE1/3/4|uniref:type II toxin-antitoxin system RelE/ParE family toxin n=1 Tax=Inquilinus sp. TaxID=1932117 RepID=UPI003782DE9C